MQRIDRVTVIGWAMILMPLLTMWHEIGGHAAVCALQGGRVQEIGAFYVRCGGLTGLPDVLVACAGAGVNVVLALVAFLLWRRAERDGPRLVLWLVWLTQAFVAVGYPAFSGITGAGDFGIGRGGALAGNGLPASFRVVEAVAGIAAYAVLIRVGIRTLTQMLGAGPEASASRKRVTWSYYATAGTCALLVGLLNPLGIFITIMSAAASTFGGLAGLIRVGSAGDPAGSARPFRIDRNLAIPTIGAVILIGYALLLGPGFKPQ